MVGKAADDSLVANDPGGLPLSGYQLYSTTDLDVAKDNHTRTLTPSSMRNVDMRLPENVPEYGLSTFSCTHNAFELQNITLNAISYDAPVRFFDVPQLEVDLCIILVLNGYCYIDDGENRLCVRPNEMFILNAGQRISALTSPNFKDIVVRIDMSTVTPLLMGMIERPTSVPLRFDSNPCADNPSANSLVRFLRLLCAEIDSEGSGLQFESVSMSFEKTLLSLLLTSIPHNYSPWLSHGIPAAAPHYVVRAERFIRQNIRSPLTLEDIIAASGTGRRSLQKSFRHFRRLTPMLYLKECRLQYARKQLQDPELRHQSIAAVAHEAGFEHPSKFSHAYRTRFNELPSETRRQSSMQLTGLRLTPEQPERCSRTRSNTSLL